MAGPKFLFFFFFVDNINSLRILTSNIISLYYKTKHALHPQIFNKFKLHNNKRFFFSKTWICVVACRNINKQEMCSRLVGIIKSSAILFFFFFPIIKTKKATANLWGFFFFYIYNLFVLTKVFRHFYGRYMDKNILGEESLQVYKLI